MEVTRETIKSGGDLDRLADLMGWSLDEDNDGQLVIYTGKQEADDGELVPFAPEEEDE